MPFEVLSNTNPASCLAKVLFSDKSIILGFPLYKYFNELSSGLFDQPRETIKMLVPAALYAMQNNLLHTALSHLDAATFQVSSREMNVREVQQIRLGLHFVILLEKE